MTTDYQLELYPIRFEREHFIKLNFYSNAVSIFQMPHDDDDQDKRQANR